MNTLAPQIKQYIMRNMLTAIVTLLLSTASFAQSFFSAGAGTGLLFQTNTPMSSILFPKYKINGHVVADLGWHYNNLLSLHGSLSLGILNGADDARYYETTFVQPTLRGRINVLPLLNKASKYRLEVDLGIGANAFYSRLYNRATDATISAIPSNRGSLSLGATGLLGGRLAIPVREDLFAFVGLETHSLLTNPYLDALKNGESNTSSSYIAFNFGVHYYFRNVIKEGEMKVSKKKYQSMNTQLQDLQDAQANAQATADMKLKEKDVIIKSLSEEVDTLRAYIANVPKITEETAKETKQVDPMEAVKNEAYRIIIGSFPSQRKAEDFVAKTPLANDDMFVVYVEKLKTYRVIYKSYDSQAAALKDLPNVRTVVKSAWVIKF
jgi:hypothetical protein